MFNSKSQQMKIILALLLILPTTSTSQIVVANNNEDSFPLAIITKFRPNGTLKYKKIFSDKNSAKFDEDSVKLEEYSIMRYTEYYENEQLRLSLKIKDSVLHGSLVTYWKNGKLKRKDLYKNGTFLEGKTWDQNGAETAYFKFKIPSQVKEIKGVH